MNPYLHNTEGRPRTRRLVVDVSFDLLEKIDEFGVGRVASRSAAIRELCERGLSTVEKEAAE